MATPDKLLFAKSHEWVQIDTEGGQKIATVGISSFAVEALTDLVHMQLPAVGKSYKPGQVFGEIESVKAVSDLYSPIEGEVIAVNSDLANHLETLNTDPTPRAGWSNSNDQRRRVGPTARLRGLSEGSAALIQRVVSSEKRETPQMTFTRP